MQRRALYLVFIAGTALPYLIGADNTAPLGTYTPSQRQHWAFVKRSRPQAPQFSLAADRNWVKNPVDAFILARLKKEGLRPARPADRATLIRRVYFDLIGLPPAPRDVAEFIADKSPDSYPKLVERLLASPQYGERWGRHWLDVVRFAETDGFEYDTHRRDAWRYRDYVINAFNSDKPYDRFIPEQLAGDEIGPNQDETLIAAGFNRLGPLRNNAGNQEVASSRNEVLMEMTNVVGSAFLGVTLGCARCHDHMFDPIRQSDYYRVQAFFAATHDHDVPKYTPADQAAWKAKAAPIEAEVKQLRAALKKCSDAEKAAIEKKIEDAEDRMPEPLASLFSVTDDPELPDSPRPRRELARWIADPANPLPARVLANRIWHYHFGRGLVATPNDFGRRGATPTHPELLDWLAGEVVRSGWSIKRLHRLILESSAYLQSSADANPAARAKDPDNLLLWRFNRRRLEAEEARDAMLAAAGTLNLKMGGPSVIVPIERELVGALYKPAQ